MTERCNGIVVSVLDSGLSSPDLSPGQGYCVLFLDKITSLSQCLSPARCTTGHQQIYCWG